MFSQRRALVIGGSVGGLFAAHLLRSIGWDVVVFERSEDDLARRGAGIGAGEALFAVMRRIGVPFDASNGIALKSRVWLEPSGNIAAELPFNAAHVATAWARLYQALKGALPGECCCFDRTLVSIEQHADRVTAIFADGSSAAGSLLIAADGIHSTVRQQLLPKVMPRYAGYVCWRGVLEEVETPSSVQSRSFDRQTFCFPEGELFLAMPNPGVNQDTPGQRRYYFIWYRPVDYEITLPDLCTDATGRRHGVAIPPPLIRPEFIHGLKASAASLLAVAQTKQPLLQAVFDLESPQLTFGRVVLLGDAAFVARPLGPLRHFAGSQNLVVVGGIADNGTRWRPKARSFVTQGRHPSATLPLRCGVLDKARTTPCPEALGEA
jgi:2-polyprenyl-6-methoxyphenol hydroxylase-like FAD-dependent oxidoreductase